MSKLIAVLALDLGVHLFQHLGGDLGSGLADLFHRDKEVGPAVLRCHHRLVDDREPADTCAGQDAVRRAWAWAWPGGRRRASAGVSKDSPSRHREWSSLQRNRSFVLARGWDGVGASVRPKAGVARDRGGCVGCCLRRQAGLTTRGPPEPPAARPDSEGGGPGDGDRAPRCHASFG